MRKTLLLAILITGCGGEIYYLDSYNYNQLGDSSYETKQLESPELEGASIEAYEFIANEIIPSLLPKQLKSRPLKLPVISIGSKILTGGELTKQELRSVTIP